MTEKSEYAREGYRFYAVITPSFHLEYELPEEDEDCTDDDQHKYEHLQMEAERLGTVVTHASYRRG